MLLEEPGPAKPDELVRHAEKVLQDARPGARQTDEDSGVAGIVLVMREASGPSARARRDHGGLRESRASGAQRCAARERTPAISAELDRRNATCDGFLDTGQREDFADKAQGNRAFGHGSAEPKASAPGGQDLDCWSASVKAGMISKISPTMP